MKGMFIKSTITLVAFCLAVFGCSSPAATSTKSEAEEKITRDSLASILAKEKELAKKIAAEAPKAEANAEKKNTPPDTATHRVPKDIVPAHKALTLIVKGLKSATAPVVVGVYGPHNKFLDEKDQMKEYKLIPHDNVLQAQISDLSYGELAMAFYQDVDNDGKITKNLIGIPTEPYAFSNNYHPSIRAPKFKECAFTYDASSNTVVVTMIK